MALRKSKPERDLAALATKVEAARANLDECRNAESEAQSERDRKLDELAADLGLGNIDDAAYERGKTEAEELLARARSERERVEAVVAALSGRAADLAHTIATAKVEAAEADERRAGEAVEAAETAMVKLRGEAALANERLEIVRRQTLDAGAAFDPVAAVQAEARAAQDEELARWHARNPHEDDRIPVHLRERVPEIRVEETGREADERERLRKHPDRVRPEDVFGDGLRPHEAFPRVGDPL